MCIKNRRDFTRQIKKEKDWPRANGKKVCVSERGRGRVHREEGKTF